MEVYSLTYSGLLQQTFLTLKFLQVCWSNVFGLRNQRSFIRCSYCRSAVTWHLVKFVPILPIVTTPPSTP